jgi:hypothetical protein
MTVTCIGTRPLFRLCDRTICPIGEMSAYYPRPDSGTLKRCRKACGKSAGLLPVRFNQTVPAAFGADARPESVIL